METQNLHSDSDFLDFDKLTAEATATIKELEVSQVDA